MTENGEYLFKTAHEVISKLKDVESTLIDKRDKPSGKLTVTTFVSFGTTWLTPRIQEFMKLNPEIEVELIFDDKELDLSTRQADIGIWARRPKKLNYIQKKLIDINYHIYGSAKYLEMNGHPKNVFDLKSVSETESLKKIKKFIKRNSFVTKRDILEHMGWGVRIKFNGYRNALRKDKDIKFTKYGYEWVGSKKKLNNKNKTIITKEVELV